MALTPAQRKRKARDAYYRRTYNISADFFDWMWTQQDRRCALCGRRKAIRYMALDHNHETNEIRSILCRVPCNRDVIAALDKQGTAGYDRAVALLTVYRSTARWMPPVPLS